MTKSENWISGTGFIPTMAAPTLPPTMNASEMGVSMTRKGPYFSCSPLVALKTPPYTPMSSPRRKTRGSRAISSSSAWVIASM